MSFLRKPTRRKAPPSLPGPSSQENATDLAMSDEIATHAPLTELPSTKRQKFTAQTAHHAPDRSGHRYDGVHTGGESKNHLGDVYNRHVTYNYGAPFLPSEFTDKLQEDEDAQSREAARLEAERRLEEEKRLASEHQRLEFIQALRFDVMDSRQATIGLAHTDTCSWIVEAPEYVRWRDESCLREHHGVLWIKGNPGCGKSTLMKYTLDIAQERDDGDIVASFFFNARGQPLEKSAEGMYRSLLRQVLSRLPHLYSDRAHVKQQSWSVEMLANMLQSSILALKPDDRLVLYVDALDECMHNEIRDVVRHFENIAELAVSRGLQFSICFSSRHYPHITMYKSEELKLDSRRGHLEDISKYVHSNVDRLSLPRSVKAAIEADIGHRSSGVFLWAVLVVKMLREKRDDGASLSQLMDSLAAVPNELGNLFTSILADSDKDMLSAFRWTLYARHQLKPRELYFAIKTSTNQLSTGEWNADDADDESIERFITRATRGLIETVKEVNDFDDDGSFEVYFTVQFIHESVREHLLQGGLAGLTTVEPHLVEGSAHADIARCCLSYIQLDSLKYLQNSEPDPFSSWFSSERFPLYDYAIDHLLFHADLAYRAGALPLTFLSEFPVRLLNCCQNADYHTRFPVVESANILYWLLVNAAYDLADALLAGCCKTEKPGIITVWTSGQSSMTIDINAHCDAGDMYGGALGAAAARGETELVQQLLRLGAEVVPSDKDMCSPLIPAVEHGTNDVVKLLLQYGADIHAVDDSEPPRTALHIATVENKYDIVSNLLAHGAGLHCLDCRRGLRASLDHALRRQYTELAQLLWDAHFPESEWNRMLSACGNQVEEHRFDAMTVHDIEYHTKSEDKSGCDSGSEVNSNDSIDSYYTDSTDSTDESITSAKTI